MIKIGKIRTTESIVKKEYEVIELEGQMYAGKDAFSFPDNQEDLRALECLSLPEEWEWTERLIIRHPNPEEPKEPGSAKYVPVKGQAAMVEMLDVLSRHETGCLTLFDETYPYAIPINHAYRDGKLYMHCAKKGKKLNLIRRNPKACYMLYGTSEPVPEGVRSCHLPYESIIFYGDVRICDDPEEKERAVFEITEQYGTPYQHGFSNMIEILVLDIHHATVRTGRFKPSGKRELFYIDFTNNRADF
jgi:nitroimidazol reductase NimA-like FMN-containing flavoprotein (pyridoxamine 5'-phosphate oxidase superfamily)